MARTRSKPVVSSVTQGFYKLKNVTMGYVYPTQYYNIETYRKTETMTDVLIPNYYSRSKAGEVFNNPMTKVTQELITVPTMGSQKIISGATEYSVQTVMDLCYTSGLAAPSTRAEEITRLKTQASTNAMAKVTSEKIQILATLGEIRETKELLANACFSLLRLRPLLIRYRDTLRKIYRSKGKKKLLAKLYIDLENVWMQIRMGWRPFIYEVKSLHEALTNCEKLPKRKTFRAKAFTTISDARIGTSWTSNSRAVMGDKTYHEEYVVRAGVLAEQRLNGFPDTFGLTKIPQTIWELTKLSWAIDYFFNVGEYIAAWTPDTLWTVRSAWFTEISLVTRVNKLRSATYAAAYPPLENGSLTEVTKTVTRTPGTSLGITFRPKMNWAKYIDILAVTRQHISPIVKVCLGLRGKRKT